MSTFLELVQDLHREAGAAGVTPTTVTNQRGEAKRLVNWIRSADMYVQNLWFNWKFLYKEFSQSTVDGTVSLAAPSDHGYWDMDTFKLDAAPIDAVEYETVKGNRRDTDTGTPGCIVVMPDDSIMFQPYADAVYAITADYYTAPVALENNSDVSKIPPRFHNIILGRALILYGNHESAQEELKQGQEIYTEYLARLEDHQLPNLRYARYAPREGSGFEVIAE